MNLIALSLGLHIVGLIFWLGPLLTLTRLLKVAGASSSSDEGMTKLVRMTWFGFVLPGAAITLGTGMFQLIAYKGMSFYMQQGWMHAKFTLILLLLVLTALTGLQVRSFSAGEGVQAKRLAAIHGIVSLLIVVTVLLTLLSR